MNRGIGRLRPTQKILSYDFAWMTNLEIATMTFCEPADPTRFGLQPNGRYLPGHAEIERICAEIQSRWSVTERIKRHAWAQPVPLMLRGIDDAPFRQLTNQGGWR
jgi:hypothetical protein